MLLCYMFYWKYWSFFSADIHGSQMTNPINLSSTVRLPTLTTNVTNQ